MTPTPRLAALAVLPHRGQVLLVRRRNPPDQGLWGYPGGKVDYGEPVMAAAIRELLEETGIEAEPLRQLGGLDIIGQGSAVREGEGQPAGRREGGGQDAEDRGAAERDAAGSGAGSVAWHYFLVPVLCRWRAGEPVAADDAEEAAWFPFAAVLERRFPMSADVDRVLREALAVRDGPCPE